ncbi:hypothetical protein UPYG_G00305420 [Umbra pygmaea]|uniref:TNFR-Cys domain-containing protein n=1 Tax=Umbra pygmaea TaxID=75934 RepID=A0ABD0WFH6_UMBPY
MMFPILVVLLAVGSIITFVCGSIITFQNTPTYQYLEPTTGKLLTCNRCPAGSHMLKHCSSTKQTECKPCPSNHYTGDWNYLPKCLYCSTFCGEHQTVKEECSRFNNRVCACEEGFYSDNDFCIRHRECPLGHGVKQKGTAESDTVCEKCPDGSFSSKYSSTDPCTNHTDCASLGRKSVIRGACWHDNICVHSCEDLKDGGVFKVIKSFLPDFFEFHKIKLARLRKLVGKLTNGVEKEGHNKRMLLDRLQGWVRDAKVEDLKGFTEILRRTHLNLIADRIERKIREINEGSNCNPIINVTPHHCDIVEDISPTE